jgi:hypothetical protein
MGNQPYVTITHYKEREFYFLNHAIQTHDGFIAKEMEQFHESEKEKFIERIRELQREYSQSQTVSVSLALNQRVTDKVDNTKASAKIFKDNYVVQDKIDIGDIPTTLYFSPFAFLYEEYKQKLDEKLTLLIGLFDRKLYIMFATKDKIQESWIIGTRGLTEKQVADRVYKSMKAYYKISYKFADHIEMLVTDDSPKLLKVLREELSLNILLRQNSIHNLLHNMAGEPKRAVSSFIKSSLSRIGDEGLSQTEGSSKPQEIATENLSDLKLNGLHQETPSLPQEKKPLLGKKPIFKNIIQNLFALIPLLFVVGTGVFFSMKNSSIDKDTSQMELQRAAQTKNALLAMTTDDIFSAMGKNAELKHATISNSKVELKGVVWGIEPLRNSLNDLYSDGEFVIKPLENFMTEFSFKSKI